MIRRLAFGIGVAVLLAPALLPGAAQAETTYRYWSYWVGGDTWTYSSRGSGFRVPPDAGVEGYRFVVSPQDGSQATAPGTASSYEALCPGQPAAPVGQKRVALVLDYGPAGIAPVGETPPATSVQCLTAPESATGLQVLQQVAELRFHSSGLICGIAGFPATECPGQSVRSASPKPPSAKPSVPATTPVAPVVPAPAIPELADPSSPSASPTTPASASPSATTTATAPSPVALAVESATPKDSTPQTPAWIAAIGAAMIAALLGLALLARRGRE